jgi:ABC-type antimicrobial peptide transport system permease subunit
VRHGWIWLTGGILAVVAGVIFLFIPFSATQSDAPMFPREDLECGIALDILQHPEYQAIAQSSEDYSKAPWGGGGGEPTQPFDFAFQASCLDTFAVYRGVTVTLIAIGVVCVTTFAFGDRKSRVTGVRLR